jgi:hypothetical protein
MAIEKNRPQIEQESDVVCEANVTIGVENETTCTANLPRSGEKCGRNWRWGK